MKTILSIFEALLFNILPAELVTHVLAFFKNIIPLIALVAVRLFLLTAIFFQRADGWMSYKFRQLTGAGEIPGRLQLKEQI